ncbi:UNVERIFIED_CONTAM: hypothetical protein Sangu_2156300 [Sesamum angustifolium]|uniref:Reverse transcriptase Ty1/copia-type domain-containing protein n=1 Tax=Sesamum angustifolium TaxID=2727405 RepID=A0AAW2LE89_9LAMI
MLDIDSVKWLEAMISKMNSMGSNQVRTLIDPPKGLKPVACKWSTNVSLELTGRLQPSRLSSWRKDILLAIVAWYDYEIWQVDVKTTFLNGYVGLSCPRRSLPRLMRSLKGCQTSPMLQSWEAFNMLSIHQTRCRLRFEHDKQISSMRRGGALEHGQDHT